MPFIAALLPFLGTVIEQVIPRFVDDKDKIAAIKAEVTAALIEQEGAMREAAAGIVLAEVQGQSWLQRNWRPLLMMVIVAILANNYVFAPYISALGGTSIALDLPERMWDLMTIGVGGYTVGRTVEKGIDLWQNGTATNT